MKFTIFGDGNVVGHQVPTLFGKIEKLVLPGTPAVEEVKNEAGEVTTPASPATADTLVHRVFGDFGFPETTEHLKSGTLLEAIHELVARLKTHHHTVSLEGMGKTPGS